MMAVKLYVVNVVRQAGLVQEWRCGGCGNFVQAGSEWLVFLGNPVKDGQPLAIPLLVHADCGQGFMHAFTWEEWRLRLAHRDPDAKLGEARTAVKAALKGWAGVDLEELLAADKAKA